MGVDLKFDAALLDYVSKHTPEEPGLYKKLRAETDTLGPISAMQISWIQARFMQLLAKLTGADSYLEIGVFTGYSTLAVSEVLPDNGRITALDIDENWTRIAKRYWTEAGVADKIDLILGNACQTLETMCSDSCPLFDIAFIDADKPNLTKYFDYSLRLVRPGGLVIVDNVLWSGAVLNPKAQDENTKAIRAFNDRVMGDNRVFVSMILIGDGLLLALKK